VPEVTTQKDGTRRAALPALPAEVLAKNPRLVRRHRQLVRVDQADLRE
jgi:hypothetical protein